MSTATREPDIDGQSATDPKTSVLSELRELAASAPALARQQGWDYLRESDKSDRRDQLAALFERGYTPDGPDGAMEGLIVGKLFGIPEAYLANPLMKIDPTWRGKTFDTAEGTGFNRLSPIARFALRAIAPLYGDLRQVNGEVVGFPFNHRLTTAAIAPFITVRALDYSPAKYQNPSLRTFPIKRTRDEIVELVPGLYLGRALLRMDDGEMRLIAYFALREFANEGVGK